MSTCQALPKLSISIIKIILYAIYPAPSSSAGTSGEAEDCHCKEEVEKEEAQALAAALEQSDLQQGKLPHVPGLSREKDEETLVIHIQDEVRVHSLLTFNNNCISIFSFTPKNDICRNTFGWTRAFSAKDQEQPYSLNVCLRIYHS